MTWNWLAWNRAYQMPALVPKVFCTLRPKATSAAAFIRPRIALTITSSAQNSPRNFMIIHIPSNCTCSILPTIHKNGLLNPLNTNAPANVLGTLPGNDT